MTNPHHHPGHTRHHPTTDPRTPNDASLQREARDNESRSEGLPGEEPRNIRKAGGGTVGDSQGGAHTGRYGPNPRVKSNRERKPRGADKAD